MMQIKKLGSSPYCTVLELTINEQNNLRLLTATKQDNLSGQFSSIEVEKDAYGKSRIYAVFENSKIQLKSCSWYFENKQLDDRETWLNLAKYKLCTDFNYYYLRDAVEAEKKLLEAQREYMRVMENISFCCDNNESYEDFRCWRELKGCPVPFPEIDC